MSTIFLAGPLLQALQEKKIWINMVTPACTSASSGNVPTRLPPPTPPQPCSDSMCRAQFINLKSPVASMFHFTPPTPSPKPKFFSPTALFPHLIDCTTAPSAPPAGGRGSSAASSAGGRSLRVLGGLLKVEHVSSLVAFWDVNVRFCQRWNKFEKKRKKKTSVLSLSSHCCVFSSDQTLCL